MADFRPNEKIIEEKPIDRTAVAINIAMRHYPFLMKAAHDDVMQEIALVELEAADDLSLRDWSNLVERRLYSFATSIGYRRSRRSPRFEYMGQDFADIGEVHDSDDRHEFRLNEMIGYVEFPEEDLWLKQAYEYCEQVLQETKTDLAFFRMWRKPRPRHPRMSTVATKLPRISRALPMLPTTARTRTIRALSRVRTEVKAVGMKAKVGKGPLARAMGKVKAAKATETALMVAKVVKVVVKATA